MTPERGTRALRRPGQQGKTMFLKGGAVGRRCCKVQARSCNCLLGGQSDLGESISRDFR